MAFKALVLKNAPAAKCVVVSKFNGGAVPSYRHEVRSGKTLLGIGHTAAKAWENAGQKFI